MRNSRSRLFVSSALLGLVMAVVAHGFVLSPTGNTGMSKAVRTGMTSLAVTVIEEDQLVKELLELSRKVGPVGSLASETQRAQVNELAQELAKIKGDPKPAKARLRGIHDLVYSAAPGGSSGRLFGTFYGKVTQQFLEDDKTFINSVKVGPLEISLQAERSVKNDKINVVKFFKSRVKLFGNTLVEKDISGGGTWKYLYLGKMTDSKGKTRLVRVMETPSLFVIEQPITSDQ